MRVLLLLVAAFSVVFTMWVVLAVRIFNETATLMELAAEACMSFEGEPINDLVISNNEAMEEFQRRWLLLVDYQRQQPELTGN